MSAADGKTRYDRLWRAMARGCTPRGESLQPCDLFPPGELPPPWTVWTLVGLFRHRRRQLWVGDVVTSRLGGDLRLISDRGALGHPESRPQTGVVPGLIEWEYFFHGRGCCLTHRVTGEAVDVDFFGDDAEGFDFYFYTSYLQSLRDPRPPERRLMELHPTLDVARLAFDALRDDGVLVSDAARYAPRLSGEALEHEAAVDGFCAAWEDASRRPWLAALVGDWLAADELTRGAGRGGELAPVAAERAALLRAERAALLTSRFDAGDEARLCLQGLADLGAAGLPALLVRALRGDVSGTTSVALEIIEARPDAAQWCPEVFRLFGRLDPGGEIPHPYLWAKAARFLLRHGYRAGDAAAALAWAGSHEVGEAALLAMEYAPASALPLLRRALRSTVPINRYTAAAALALVDRPWSRAELLAALRESDDQEMTSECRAALSESRDPATRQAARDWEERNPHEPEAGPSITMREMSLRHAPAWLRYEMDKLRGRVMPLADREFPGGG